MQEEGCVNLAVFLKRGDSRWENGLPRDCADSDTNCKMRAAVPNQGAVLLVLQGNCYSLCFQMREVKHREMK